jgi:hypothetical protein
MTENRYLAKDSPDAFERERLALLTRFADPITTRRLTDLGVGPGWCCLDVGAGNGSVARWLAGRVGPEGRVVATDLNPRFLGGHGLPNLEVRRHNILEDDLEAAHYDLVHCRALLMTGKLVRDRIVAAGVLTEADFDQLERAYDDPSFWFVGFTMFGAWGRRPG